MNSRLIVRLAFACLLSLLSASDLVLMCRVGQKIVGVPPRRMLSGTTILTVDRGQLVLARELALNLGLI